MSGSGARPRRRDAVLGVALVAVAGTGIGLVVRSGQVLATGKHLPPQYSISASATSTSAPVTTARTASSAPVRRATPVDTAVAEFVPTSLRMPGLQVDAPVIGVTSDVGTLNPPERPQTVGWWLGSALAGADVGTTVVVGHIDSATRGVGALFHLDRVKAGDTILLTSSHTTATYRVVSLHFYVKTAGLPRSLFARSGPPRLVVISCGGTFDRAERSYRENVVVVAEPVDR